MPNSFTVFPGIIPGNLQVQGNLTVAGDQVRIGAAAPFVRIGKDNAADLLLSQNLGFDNATLDSAGVTAVRQSLRVSSMTEAIRRVNAAGTVQDKALPETLFASYTSQGHTGDTLEDTIYSKVIPANTLGANGALQLELVIVSTAQGATTTLFRVGFNATKILLDSFTAVHQKLYRFRLANQNALNSNVSYGEQIDLGVGSVVGGLVPLVTTIDFSVDQTFSITAQNGTSTDTQLFRVCTLHALNSFGPV